MVIFYSYVSFREGMTWIEVTTQSLNYTPKTRRPRLAEADASNVETQMSHSQRHCPGSKHQSYPKVILKLTQTSENHIKPSNSKDIIKKIHIPLKDISDVDTESISTALRSRPMCFCWQRFVASPWDCLVGFQSWGCSDVRRAIPVTDCAECWTPLKLDHRLTWDENRPIEIGASEIWPDPLLRTKSTIPRVEWQLRFKSALAKNVATNIEGIAGSQWWNLEKP